MPQNSLMRSSNNKYGYIVSHRGFLVPHSSVEARMDSDLHISFQQHNGLLFVSFVFLDGKLEKSCRKNAIGINSANICEKNLENFNPLDPVHVHVLTPAEENPPSISVRLNATKLDSELGFLLRYKGLLCYTCIYTTQITVDYRLHKHMNCLH